MIRVPVHDPEDRLDYGVDWGPFLAESEGDTIVAAEWLNPQEGVIAVEEPSLVDGRIHRAFLTGGVVGGTYRVMSRIETAQGRVRHQSITFTILEM